MPSNGAAHDHFGTSVAVFQDTVVVGAWLADTAGGTDTGAAYVFVRSGTAWTERQTLVASDAAPSHAFGVSVSVFDDTIVVGAEGNGGGAAYVFQRTGTTWTQEQRLTVADPTTFFGMSVSIFMDTIVVGAPYNTATSGGSAHVFVRSGTSWTLQQRLSGGLADNFGRSVRVQGNTAVIGAPAAFAPGGYPEVGAVFVFVRSGAIWTQQQRLQASDWHPHDRFGASVAISGEVLGVSAPTHVHSPNAQYGAVYVFERSGSGWMEQQELAVPVVGEAPSALGAWGDTLVAGAPDELTPLGNSGAAHVFRGTFPGPHADLTSVKSDGQTTAVPGEPLTYTLTVTNAGPDAVSAARVRDVLPPALLGPTWTCVSSAGSVCAPAGSGSIDDSVNVNVGGILTYFVTGTVAAGATGAISNSITVTAPPGALELNPDDNYGFDSDVLAPQADLTMSKSDSADPVSQNDPLTYVLTVKNNGPSDATGVTVTDALPAGVTFVSSVPGAPTCTLSGGTLTCGLGALPAAGTATITINTTVNATGGMLVNTASVSANEPDPDPRNNSASAATAVGRRGGELAHGTDALYDLAAQGGVADADVFRINQKPYASYEIVVDATSGDIGVGSGPAVERVAPDGTTVVQESAAIGTGSSRSLRWRNTSAGEVEGDTVRVRSVECGTDCGPDDVYRIRAYETTYSIPRFNNAGTQITVLILQNPTNYPISGEAYFRITSGILVANQSFSLGPKETLVLNTATIPGANGVSGAITVAHDGRYGDLSGKTVALEPSTGFSFDSPLVPRIP